MADSSSSRELSRLPARHEARPEHTWDIASVFPDDAAWESAFGQMKSRVSELSTCRGTLGHSGQSLLHCLRLSDELSLLLERLIVYARMRRDEDNANGTYQALAARAMSLATDYASAEAFVAPEILAIAEEDLRVFLAEEPGLAVYQHYLDKLRLQRNHVRSSDVEEVLAQAGEIARTAHDVYGMLTNADMRFPGIIDEQGNEVELTKGRYQQFMESFDRRVRKDAFVTIHNTYGLYRNTIAASLFATVRGDVFYARARGYASALEASLQPENIPVAVYHNLIQTVEKNLPALHRYTALRKRLLGLDELHMYDLYVPLVTEIKQEIPFEEGVQMVGRALAPLGEEYVGILSQGIRDRWVDVYENKGKTSGAYSDGAYDTHPFVLLNYQDNLSSVFTLAHELGHSMHSYCTRRTQPHIYGDYTLFVAEVASTFNEALLSQDLLRTSLDERFRLYLINQHLEKFRTTLYRQAMFAEFESIAHEKVANGEALTADLLCELHADLNRKYHGPTVYLDPEIAIEWARIPHFYSAFYVYQYATGIAAATALAQAVLEEGRPAVERYLGFLSAGSSAYSIDLLKGAGVDMASAEPVQRALDVFARLLDEAETLTRNDERRSAGSAGS